MGDINRVSSVTESAKSKIENKSGFDSRSKWGVGRRLIVKHWQFYLFIVPAVAYIIIFKYVPMAGAQIAFRDFSPVRGIWGSEWIGLREFARFVNSPNFEILI